MTRHDRLMSMLLVAALVTGCAGMKSADDPACDDGTTKPTRERKFKVDENDGCVIQVLKLDDTDGEIVRAHRCDYVEWKIKGKKKSVAFETSAGTPFVWSESGFKGKKIRAQIRKDAVDTVEKEYKYTVKTEGLGCEHDPMIIVQP